MTTIYEPRTTTETGVWTAIGYDGISDTFVVIGWAPYFTAEAGDPERGSVLHVASRRAAATRFAGGFRRGADKRTAEWQELDRLARVDALVNENDALWLEPVRVDTTGAAEDVTL